MTLMTLRLNMRPLDRSLMTKFSRIRITLLNMWFHLKTMRCFKLIHSKLSRQSLNFVCDFSLLVIRLYATIEKLNYFLVVKERERKKERKRGIFV